MQLPFLSVFFFFPKGRGHKFTEFAFFLFCFFFFYFLKKQCGILLLLFFFFEETDLPKKLSFTWALSVIFSLMSD